MNVPVDLHYTEEHEWVRLDGPHFVVGITDFAQSAMGDVVHVDLPELGKVAAAGDSLAEIESTKSVSEIYAPVAGRVTSVNDSINDNPELVNNDPYGAGWIFVLEPADTDSYSALLTPDAYASKVAEESEE